MSRFYMLDEVVTENPRHRKTAEQIVRANALLPIAPIEAGSMATEARANCGHIHGGFFCPVCGEQMQSPCPCPGITYGG